MTTTAAYTLVATRTARTLAGAWWWDNAIPPLSD